MGKSKIVKVICFERLRRCCENDYQCECGGRITFNWHTRDRGPGEPVPAPDVVKCPHCGRQYLFEDKEFHQAGRDHA